MYVCICVCICVSCVQAADRFGIERLKRICEHTMLASISVENAALILLAADTYNVRADKTK